MEEDRMLTIVIARHLETSRFSPTQIWAFLRISVLGRTPFLSEETISTKFLPFSH
jgi:hypothetical protein